MEPYTDSFNSLIRDFLSYSENSSPAVILYAPSITGRLSYTCDFIFKQGLRVNYQITDNAEEFKNSRLPKINYSESDIPGAINILPSSLLFETGIRKLLPKGEKKNGLVYFFYSGSAGFHFDIFSAVFYFISRYEEYLSYVKDSHGRFEVRASLLYYVSFYREPLIDKWIFELKEALLKVDPSISFPEKKFRYLSTIDVDNVYAFKTKPFGRMAGANLKDFLSLNFANISHRFQTRYMKRPDPFDAYNLQTEISVSTEVPLLYFFLCRNNTAFDRTINPDHPLLKELIQSIRRKKAVVGIHPSFFSIDDPELFEKEIDLLSGHTGEKIEFSRQHYLRFDIEQTPKELIKQGIKYDFTMGYSSEAGYRAGTTLPFYYYDFKEEKALRLMAVPFVVMDGSYYQYQKLSVAEAETDIINLAEAAKKVNGLFVTVFHDRTFWEKQFPGWKKLYLKLQKQLS